jgi:photosystem II stability/assembly factor-like uncharacterized protein
VLETFDSGQTWKPGTKFTEDNIKDLYFKNLDEGWALCERDIFSLGSASPSYILKTSNGGATWEAVQIEDLGKERLARIFFSKTGEGWAVGEAGSLFTASPEGTTWRKLTLPVRYLMLGGSFNDRLSGIIVGGRGSSLFTEDGGQTWKFSTFSAKPETRLSAVHFINPKTGWAVGAEGKVFATSSGGKFWREQNSNVKADLTDVFFLNNAEGWAVGESGVILHTLSGGGLWRPVETPVKHRLEQIVFVGKTGWAVGFGGTILKYDATAQPQTPGKRPELLRRTISTPQSTR